MSDYSMTTQDNAQWWIPRGGVTDSFGPAGLAVPQRYKRVAFETRDGDSSYVEVAFQPGWQEEAVRQIQQHVDELYALKAMRGPTT